MYGLSLPGKKEKQPVIQQGLQVQILDLLILFILVFYLNKLAEKILTFFEIFS